MVSMSTLRQSLSNPTRFMELSATALPCVAGAAGLLLPFGLYLSFTAPLDYQQGHAAKIMFVHVPRAWLSMFGYVLVAVSSFGLLVFRHPLADVSAKAAAPIGAVFTGLCLLTACRGGSRCGAASGCGARGPPRWRSWSWSFSGWTWWAPRSRQ